MRYRFLIEFARQDYKAAREAGLILANSLGKDAHVVEVYLDAFFQTDRGPGARQELQGWLDQADRGGNYEGLLNHLDLVNFFAWSGDFANALKMVQRSIENDHLYLYGFLRVDRSMPEFLCEKKTQAVFDAAGLPPLKQPYPCRQGP
jgi:hypothetical protein